MRRLGGLALGLVLAVAVAAPAPADPSPAGVAFSAAEPAADPEGRTAGSPDASPSTSAGGDAAARLADAPAPPSVGIAVARFLGAIAVVGVLLTLTLVVLRALFRQPGAVAPDRIASTVASRLGWRALWRRAPGRAEGLEIVERGYVGAKESVCVVRVGAERFLIGVTPTRISLLGRLGSAPDSAAAMPAAVDFGAAVTGAPVARPEPADALFRALLERSRERLARLESEPVPAGGRQ